jgi:hypothetical protein
LAENIPSNQLFHPVNPKIVHLAKNNYQTLSTTGIQQLRGSLENGLKGHSQYKGNLNLVGKEIYLAEMVLP